MSVLVSVWKAFSGVTRYIEAAAGGGSAPSAAPLFIALLLENFEYIWEGEYAIEEVHPLGLGRIVALHHHSATSYQICEHIRRPSISETTMRPSPR